MFLFKKLLVTFALLSSVDAAAIPEKPSSPELTTRSPELETRATQSCHATYNALWSSYNIWIGVPYIGQSDCDATKDAISACLPTLYKCRNENGYIRLNFNAMNGYGKEINDGLHSRYPSVNEFNCPDD